MDRFANASAVALGMILGIGSLAGCGGESAPSGDVRAARGVLKVLGMEYGNYLVSHGNAPPADKEELTEFLETRKNQITGLQSVEQLFTSPRDNQPLVVYYGEALPPPDETGFPAVASEKQGANGQCLVANTRGGVYEMSLDELPDHLKSTP